MSSFLPLCICCQAPDHPWQQCSALPASHWFPSPLLPNPATHPLPPRQAPCPPKQPLVEHALSMAQFTLAGGNIEDLLLQWSREVGPFYVFNIPGNPPVLVVSDPDAVKEVGHSTHQPTPAAACLVSSYPCQQRHAAAVFFLTAKGPCARFCSLLAQQWWE
jgi:hypothetical protein